MIDQSEVIVVHKDQGARKEKEKEKNQIYHPTSF